MAQQGGVRRGEKHGTAKELLAQFPGAKYFLVCRNPYARLVSWYNFRVEWHNTHGSNLQIPKAAPGMTNDKALEHFSGTFDDWLGRIDFEKPVGHNWDFAGIQKQKSYLDIKNPPIHILRQENLANDIKVIENMLGNRKVDLGNANASKRVNWTDYYKSDFAKEFVYTHWKEDFEFFGYEKIQ